jgi:23S rRNA pseudouridine1911/1915/1917 synthase
MTNTDRTSTLAFPILAEDTHFLVISKPAGWLSQGDSSGARSVIDELRIYLGRPYVALIHRLDRHVTGALLIAKRTKAASRLNEQMRAGKICRHYAGWVWGRMESETAWNDFIHKDPQQNMSQVSAENFNAAKRCELRVRPVQNHAKPDLTLLEFEPLTGRSHQIRAQSAFHGFPIVGDPKYGAGKILLPADSPFVEDSQRPLLHCQRLRFFHPISGEPVTVECPLPPEMRVRAQRETRS